MTYKEAILEAVSNGIKNVDLALKVMERINPLRFDEEEFHLDLDVLISSGEIIEIEYFLPQMIHRAKSFFLPKGTIIRIVKQ